MLLSSLDSTSLKLSLGGFGALLVGWYLVATLNQYIRLRHFRGPTSAAFSKWWLARCIGSGRANLALYEVTEKYGSIARVGPSDLVTSDPDLMKRMLNVHTEYKRSDWYTAMQLEPGYDNVFSQRNDELHNQLRAKMAAGYSGREVENLEKKINENVLRLVDLVEKRYVAHNKPFDLARKVQYFTLDVISDLAFGAPFGDVASDSDLYDYIKTTETTLANIIVATVLPWLLTLLTSPLMKPFMPTDRDALGIGKIMGIAKQVARERYGPDAKVKKDMLGSFVSHGLTLREAESEILIQIVAGSDTTATAIRATMLHLMTSPRVLAKLRTEIASSPRTTPVISDAEARAMPYLQAVVKEGLRIYPPVTGLMSKDVPPAGDTFKGTFIPGGTRIGYCAWGIFRDKEIWGDDADEFRPERWLEASPEKLKELESTLELVFSYGKWQCLGRSVALIELNKVFVELFRRFDFVVVNPEQPWKSKCYGIFIQSDYWVRAYPREE